MEVLQAKWLKSLGQEKLKLKNFLAEPIIDNAAPQEMLTEIT